MKKKLLIFPALALLASCGSHKSAQRPGLPAGTQQTGKGKQDNSQTTAQRPPEYDGEQWVRNMSLPYSATKGLAGRHIALWASHGRYYDKGKDSWQWQRPRLYSTTEDLFTQTIVVPYLMPMLEKAGASVFSPRERDWQPREVVVDNDTPQQPCYTETSVSTRWADAGTPGFGGNAMATLYGSSNPFTWGTARKAKAQRQPTCMISYQPQLDRGGRYAVYVSYATLPESVDDAEYTVVHKGVRTVFHVNQQMGGSTWVYLGTFDFAAGCSADNRVFISNASRRKGVVTADAVRFGGGMGTVSRGGQTSGLPRCLEGARYYAQYAGAPDSVWTTYKGADDYKDDINARSRMTNWLAGGSCFVPGKDGKKVPIELSLAVHSDAGYNSDFRSIYGSLSICTTNARGGKLADGTSRQQSKDFARMLLYNLGSDMRATYGQWNTREIYDRNYSESRVPDMPSAIIETLSHQSFPDMVMAQDPGVKFTIARSLYKTILKYTAQRHGKSCQVAPLPPQRPSVRFVGEGIVELQWSAQDDPLEPSAKATQYIVYTSAGSGSDFDNGEMTEGRRIRLKLSPGALYRFKVAAVNKGGESFCSPVVSAIYHPGATKTILIVDGFSRLSAPAVVQDLYRQGFDIEADPGVQMGMTVGWSGEQTQFDKSTASTVGPGSLGYGTGELEGQFIMGNTLDNASEHAAAMLDINDCNVVSATADAVIGGDIRMGDYSMTDLLLGNQRFTPTASRDFKAFPASMQRLLSEYTGQGGRLLVSGAYLSTDMSTDTERRFLSDVLHIGDGQQAHETHLSGMGTQFDIYSELNDEHYAATNVDIVKPQQPAFCALTYQSGMSACVAFKGQVSRTIAMGFPLECIRTAKARRMVMKGIVNFLLR